MGEFVLVGQGGGEEDAEEELGGEDRELEIVVFYVLFVERVKGFLLFAR